MAQHWLAGGSNENQTFGKAYYYENIGTVDSPAFAEPLEGAFGLDSLTEIQGPLFFDMADLDDDGDLDLMASFGGQLLYYQNNGTTPTSVKEEWKENVLRFFPNPVSNELYLQIDQPIKTLTLYDLFSRPVLFSKDRTSSLDLSAFSSGSYILKVRLEDGSTIVRRILKR